MIAYKYKLYQTKRTKHLDAMLREASFVWNHALALQKRYYSLFGKYISKNAMQKHYAKRIKRTLLHSQTTQEIIERLDTAYQRFFKKLAKRPPKFRRAIDFYSIVYKQGGFSLNGNVLTVNTIKKRFKFSYSRPYEGRVKRIAIKRSRLGEYYLIITTDAEPKAYGKTHDGASVGIDFGLKTYIELWCNGNTADFGSAVSGSSPDSSTNHHKTWKHQGSRYLSIIAATYIQPGKLTGKSACIWALYCISLRMRRLWILRDIKHICGLMR